MYIKHHKNLVIDYLNKIDQPNQLLNKRIPNYSDDLGNPISLPDNRNNPKPIHHLQILVLFAGDALEPCNPQSP